MKLVFNSWQTWVAYNLRNDIDKDDKLYTSSPGLYESVKRKYDINDLSESIGVDEGNQLGDFILGWTLKWQKIIDDECFQQLGGIECGKILSKSLHHLMVSLAYHYLELLKITVTTEKVKVPYLGTSQGGQLGVECAKKLVSIKPNYYALLAQHPILSDELEAIKLDVTANEMPEMLPGNLYNLEDGWFDRIKIQLLKWASIRNQWFAWQIWGRIYGNRKLIKLSGLFWKKNITVLLFTSNEVILGIMRLLLWNRYRAEKIDIKDAVQNVDKYKVQAKLIENLLCDSLDGLEPNKKWLRKPLTVAARSIDLHVNTYLLPMYESLNEYLTTKVIPNLDGKKSVFVTNGLYDSVENMFGEMLRKNNIPVINFEHGCIGLLERYKSAQQFSDMTRTNGYVCYNAYEKEFYRKLTNDYKTEFFVQGAQYEHSVPYINLAKWAMRKVWKIQPKRKVLLYAPTRFKDGHIWLPHGVRDMQYWSLMKKLISDVLANCSYQSFIKFHQKGLGAADVNVSIYKSRKQPLKELQLPKNVQLRSYPDLRFCRHAAEIIIIDRATSTLGWVLATNVPTIYLNMISDPLTQEVRKVMGESMFVFDVLDETWSSDLLQLLDLSYEEILKLWEEKEESRKRFIEGYVLGPNKGHIDLMEWVIGQATVIDAGNEDHAYH